jgi:hypothetical protein
LFHINTANFLLFFPHHPDLADTAEAAPQAVQLRSLCGSSAVQATGALQLRLGQPGPRHQGQHPTRPALRHREVPLLLRQPRGSVQLD